MSARAKGRPFLQGKRIYLRCLAEEDVTEDYVGWLNDQEVTRFTAIGRFPSTHESV